MTQYEENRQKLIDNYYRTLLLGVDKVRFNNLEYYVKDDIIAISRIYNTPRATKIIIPDEFDALYATMIRKKLIYLDLGRCKKTNIFLKQLDSLEVFIAKELDLLKGEWHSLLKGAYNLKVINVDKLRFKYESYLAESKYTITESSFKSMVIIYERGFKDYVKMKKITLSKSLKEICQDAFSTCVSLETVDFYGSEEDLAHVSIEAGNECFKKAKFNFLEERT